MTEEIKTEVNAETKECNCICKSQAVKNILTVATGSFLTQLASATLAIAANIKNFFIIDWLLFSY